MLVYVLGEMRIIVDEYFDMQLFIGGCQDPTEL